MSTSLAPAAAPGVPSRTPRHLCLEYVQGACPVGPRCPLIHPPEDNIAEVVALLRERLGLPKKLSEKPVVDQFPGIPLRNTKGLSQVKRGGPCDEICLKFLCDHCPWHASCHRLHISPRNLALALQPRLVLPPDQGLVVAPVDGEHSARTALPLVYSHPRLPSHVQNSNVHRHDQDIAPSEPPKVNLPTPPKLIPPPANPLHRKPSALLQPPRVSSPTTLYSSPPPPNRNIVPSILPTKVNSGLPPRPSPSGKAPSVVKGSISQKILPPRIAVRQTPAGSSDSSSLGSPSDLGNTDTESSPFDKSAELESVTTTVTVAAIVLPSAVRQPKLPFTGSAAGPAPKFCDEWDRTGHCSRRVCSYIRRDSKPESGQQRRMTAPNSVVNAPPATVRKAQMAVSELPRPGAPAPRRGHASSHGHSLPINVLPKANRNTLPVATRRPARSVATAPPKPVVPRFVPPKRPASEDMTVEVFEPVRVTFGPGFKVLKLVTAFESLWITLANVPVDTTRDSLERLLAPFGCVVEVRFRDESNTGATATIVSAQMSAYPEAVAAIDALDDAEVFGTRIRVRSSMGRTAVNRRLQDRDIRISWAAPSKVGYAGYATLQAARKAVTAADGAVIRDHWVTASTYDGLPVVGSYNVRFQGLPPDAHAGTLKPFGPREGTMFERPNYSAPKFGVPAVESLLVAFGAMESFEAIPPPYKDGAVRVWARFESPDVAKVVCELDGVKQRALGGEKLHVHRVQSLVYPVPREIYESVEFDIIRLRQSIWSYARGAHLTILDRSKASLTVAIKLVAEDSKTLSKMKAELSQIVQGELVKDSSGTQAWDDYFGRAVGMEFLEYTRRQNPGILIHSDKFRRCIRVVGPAGGRRSIIAAILTKLHHLRSSRIHTISLAGRLIGLFVSADLTAVQQRYGVETVWLDLTQRVLCVRGDEALYEQVQEIVHRIRDGHPGERVRDRCPVCFEEPTTPITLYCGHTYCKTCLSGYLKSAVDNRSFPLKCLGDGVSCNDSIPMTVARDVLPAADFQSIILAAFHVHVHARPEEFHYCPTPDCQQVYRAGPRDTVLNCPSCLIRLCPHCHVEYHEGVTCADRTHGEDKLFEQWVSTHDVKKCPGCHAPIERAEGCNHMTCSRCKTHTCWECLETFEQGKGIYDHMRSVHGNIGL